MSDRLTDLQRQRALALEQLAWIDRAIAQESGLGQPPATPAMTVAAAPQAPTADETARLAEEIIARYQPAAAASRTDVKRGCFLYFGLAFLLLAAGLAAFYFISAARR